jgi:hypothetical protein
VARTDGYGLQRTEWHPAPLDHINPSQAYADARHAAKARTEAYFNSDKGAASGGPRAEPCAAPATPESEASFSVIDDRDVELVADSLMDGGITVPGVVTFGVNPMSSERPTATAISVSPLQPMSVRKAMEVGLIDFVKGFRKDVYERMVQALPNRSGKWRAWQFGGEEVRDDQHA